MYVKKMIVKKKNQIKNVKKFIKQDKFISKHMLIFIENSEVI